MAAGVVSKGTTIEWADYDDSLVLGAYSAIGGITGIGTPGGNKQWLDNTDMLSSAKEWLPGLIDNDTGTFNVKMTKTTYSSLVTSFKNSVKHNFKISFSDGSLLVFDAYIDKVPLDIKTNDLIRCNVSLKVSGNLTYYTSIIPSDPTVSLASGTYNGVQTVTLTGMNGATLEYSFNNTLWLAYTTGVSIPATCNFYSRQSINGVYSNVVSRAYTITQSITQNLYYSGPSTAGVALYAGRNAISPTRWAGSFNTGSDAGQIQTWKFASNGAQKIVALGSAGNNTGTVFLKMSTDGGRNWTDKTSVVTAVSPLAINHATDVAWLGGTTWICFGRYGSYYTTNDFGSVTSLGAPFATTYDGYALSDDHHTVYICGYGTGNAVLKKFTLGDSAWTTVYTLANSTTKYLYISGNTINLVVSGGTGVGSHLSANGGTSFTALGYSINRMARMASGRLVFFTGGTATLRYSDNDGATITDVDNTQFTGAFEHAQINTVTNRIYVAATISTRKLMVSDATGISYSLVSALPSSLTSVVGIDFDSDGRIYLNGTGTTTIAETGNAGETWFYPEQMAFTSTPCYKAIDGLVDTSYGAELISIGDSIMVGHNASEYESTAFRSLIASNGDYTKGQLLAYTGWRIYNAQNATYQNLKTWRKQDVILINPGTNDRADSTNDATYIASKKELAAYCAFPNSTNKFSARSIASRTGTWANETVFGTGIVSTTNGSSITFSVSGDVAMIAYRAYASTNGGVASVTIDGVSKGNLNGNDGNKNTTLLKTYTGLGTASAHTVTITLTSATSSSNPIGIHWVAGSVIPSNVECPNVVAIPITPRTDGYGAATTWNGYLATLVADLCSYNSRIKLGVPDIITGFNTGTMIDSDQIHPTTAGHSFISAGIVTYLNSNYSLVA